MKHPNGSGSIKRLSGNRRRPYAYVVTIQGKQKAIAYFSDIMEAEIYRANYCQNTNLIYKKDITFLETYAHWLQFHIAKTTPASSTINNYKVAFIHCKPIHHKEINTIKYHHLQNIIDDMLKSGLSYSSVKKVRSLISLVFKYALINDYTNKNYANLLHLGPNKPVFPHKKITRHKINRLWSIAADDIIAQSILVLIYTGLRVGELLALKKQDINLKRKFISVKRSKTQAGIRIIPIHDSIFPFIPEVLNLVSGMSYSCYRNLFSKCMKKINGNHKPHDTRHTFASMLDDLEVNYNAKRLLLGHAGTNVTDSVYTHKGINQLRKAINKLK